MPYLFATQDQDYSDFSSGRVLYSQPGAPAFPIRLASEIFQRALRWMKLERRLCLYDPTCGGAYHLTTLGLLHGEVLRQILASDVSENVLGLAQRNLSLLTQAGLARREQEIQAMLAAYGKNAHTEALHSLSNLRQRLAELPEIKTRVFQANALDAGELLTGLAGDPVDLVISDIPYGQLSHWQPGSSSLADAARAPVQQMLEALLPVLSNKAVVAIASDKQQKVAHAAYRRLEHFKLGKRQVVLLSPAY